MERDDKDGSPYLDQTLRSVYSGDLNHVMKIVSTLDELKNELHGSPFIATIGFFDGVHMGHRALIRALKKEAEDKGIPSVVLALDRTWAEAVGDTGLRKNTLLCSLRKKINLLAEQPGDIVFLVPFTKELALQDMDSFILPLIAIGLRGMVLGYDSRFGRREHDLETGDFDERLRALADGLIVKRISPVIIDGAPVSSSRIRECVLNGDFPRAEELLGRTFSLIGEVESGRQIGRKINYPTANIVPIEKGIILPRSGVFVSEVRVEDQVYPSMSYYGTSPTITGENGPMRIEAFLFGFNDNLYGRQAEIAFRSRLRDDRVFASLEELRLQLSKDEEATQDFFRQHRMLLT